MPRTLENITHARVVHAAISELRTHRADLLVTMRRLDRADTRLAHARMAAAITCLDDTIEALEVAR